MKMKRMSVKEVDIGGFSFKIRPFGAMDASYIFGDVVSIVLPIIGTVALSSNDSEKASIAVSDNMKLDAESIATSLGKLNGKELTNLIRELLLDHNNVSFRYNEDGGEFQRLTRDDFDEIFCMYFAGALKLCAEVLIQNYGNFFGDASTLFGSLLDRFLAEKSKSTASLTTNA